MRDDIVTIKRVCTPSPSHDPQFEDNRAQLVQLTRLLGIPLRGKLADAAEDSGISRGLIRTTDTVFRSVGADDMYP